MIYSKFTELWSHHHNCFRTFSNNLIEINFRYHTFHPKFTIRWFLVYLQICATITSQFQNISSPQKRNLVLLSYCSFSFRTRCLPLQEPSCLYTVSSHSHLWQPLTKPFLYREPRSHIILKGSGNTHPGVVVTGREKWSLQFEEHKCQLT